MTIDEFNPQTFKDTFPLFRHPDNQKLIYLDNAATHQRPQPVIDAIVEYYQTHNANANRSSHRLAQQAGELLSQTRAQVAQFIGAFDSEIVFCRGATEGLNLLAFSIGALFEKNEIHGGEIILSHAEHHANLLPWQLLAKNHNLDLVFLPNLNHQPDLSVLQDHVTAKTRIIALTHTSNVLGCNLDLSPLAHLRDHPCFTVVDCAQGIAHSSLNVQELQCDFLVGSAHKCYGPFGAGFVYGRQSLLSLLPPWQRGGEMVKQARALNATFAQSPSKFEAGTLSLADITGFGAAIRFLCQQDRQRLHEHEAQLGLYLYNRIEAMGIPLLSARQNMGIVTFNFDEKPHHRDTREFPGTVADLAIWLDQHNIASRAGFHCAHPLYHSLKATAGLRLSLAGYNTKQDCESALDCIQSWLDECGSKTQALKRETHAPKHTASCDLLADIAAAPSGQARYKALLRAGQRMESIPEIRQEHLLVSECETKTWLHHRTETHQHFFLIDSDSKLVKGLSGLLLCWFNGKSTEYIQNFPWREQLEQQGLVPSLSISRQRGFKALIVRAQELASAEPS